MPLDVNNKEMVKNKSPTSIQNRYNLNKEDGQVLFLNNLVRIINKVNYELPPYGQNMRERDAALMNLVKSEPVLAGVLSNATSIDKSRGWSLVGTEKQVKKWGSKLHNLSGVGNYRVGWRKFVEKNSHAWYSTNIGFVSEVAFTSRNGTPSDLYFVDPTKLTLEYNDPQYPLRYHSGNVIKLQRNEYIHGNSMEELRDEYSGYGYCAIERALNFARMMIGLTQHHLEKFNVAPPKGFLHITGITRKEFNDAVEQAQADMDMANYRVYKDIIALLTSNSDSKMELVPLSTLPDNFTLSSFIETIVNGYSLAFNSSLYNFWLPASNNLGRGTEAKESLNSAKERGEIDFALTFQEQMQHYFLPSTVSFEFDDNNVDEQLSRVELDAKYASMVDTLSRKKSEGEDEALLTRDEARQMLAQRGIISQAWTVAEEDYEVSDIRANDRVMRAIYNDPDEPVIRYKYNQGKISYYLIAKSGSRLMRKVF